ncbi:dihydroneopterin aldolase [Synechococcales cyanobacterium C]|uniref:7,8-dihydroneopterin aldolase n=1 Tax=Petrachloros mirabilis ULC683 TaxID=2781853 RepID=A0A8K1ZZV2_9CYAN|nr:dihydroneopterin aldolase [Petrachloros mirabilis]NCJ07028.1 dihydroneopterin aldolase [Petrachloros mirabilis ULC683]
MDSLHVTGIRGYGYTGALPEEQVLGQWFQVDLTFWLDLAPAGISDTLIDTLDYREAIRQVQTLLRTARFTLIERLASEIANHLLQLPQVAQVQVKLTKLTPPIADFSGQVTVDILRPLALD